MINICTVADSNFLLRFLALNRSIENYTKNFKINLLCLDKEIFDKLHNKYEHINCHYIENLKKIDKDLQICENNEPSYEALNVSSGDKKKAKRIQFIWSLAAYYCWYCLSEESWDHVYYFDADLYFFEDPEILNDFSDFGSIGLIENRAPYSPINGKYNVGIIYFKNDKEGLSCSEFWKDCMMDANNKYAKEYGTCGDQKYLELFPQKYSKVFQLDDYIGHLAPWSVANHTYLLGKISYEGKMQELLFYHFSNFSYDFQNKSYSYAPRHGLHSAPNNTIAELYQEYYKTLEELNENNIWNDSI